MSEIRTRVKTAPIVEVSENTDETAEDRLLKFVEDNISKVRGYSNLGDAMGTPGFSYLNSVLSNYASVQCSLVALDVMAKMEKQKADDEFDEWMAEKYMEARGILNPLTLSGQKWASKEEITFYVMNHWKDDYWRLRNEKDACEKKVAFCRRMLDTWESFKFNVNTLCKNVQAEAIQLGAGVISVE